ncbi:hypothetical protein [Mesorhizobium captivum]|uniref:hypothetical protein n=1 Tax=Mesorhizobium captivum TaxID=3072319 RepID=UPI002A2479ED|nr:hypothetical protein [Mesorhizobium sp. VK3C]MDX8450867.1 hypothetical protein [Mesorhizobium sp. VK3C]
MTAPDPQLEAYVSAFADLRRYIGRDPIAIVQEEEPPAPFPKPDRRPELLDTRRLSLRLTPQPFAAL